jgi:hypothetical protein
MLAQYRDLILVVVVGVSIKFPKKIGHKYNRKKIRTSQKIKKINRHFDLSAILEF